MSYVSIWKPIEDQIVQASGKVRNEIIGLLLGRLDSDTIIIEDSITGEFEAREHGATLPTATLAKIADDIVSGRIKGSIVGWYHSHTEGGLFLSDTDIQTQKNLQQFSSLVTAMVVDSNTGEVGFFRVDPQTGRQTRVPESNLRVFENLDDAVPVERKGKPAIRATPTIEVQRQPIQPRQQTGRLVIAALLVALVVSLGLLGFLFARPQTPVGFVIIHTPIHEATIGSPIQIIANVTGNIRSVNVYYSPATTEEFTQTEMEPVASGLYEYTIPGGRVTGNLKYFIAAADSLGNQQETGVYTIPVADFSIFPSSPTITVYRNGSSTSSLNLVYANGFNEPLTFSASGTPQGLTVTFSPNPIPGGASKTALRVSADSTPPDGAFSILLTASFSPSESTPVAREAALGVLVADFGMQVAPISRTINVAGTATYAITIAISQGFVDPVKVTVQGLPQGASYELTTTDTSAVLGGTGTMTLTLRIITTSSVKPGSYALTIVAVGGGLSHHVTVQLIVR